MTAGVVLRKTSLIDYPGLVSAVIFFPGCNLRCPWCHNGELVTGTAPIAGSIPLEEALGRLEKRRRVLGGLVLSGGEPTLVPELPELVGRIKLLGFKVKLDTNGMLPELLEKLLSSEKTRPHYIAMDLKIAPERYGQLNPQTRGAAERPGDRGETQDAGERLRRSAALIRRSGLDHEFRSLRLPAPYFGKEDLAALAPLAGSSPWHIRPFVPGNCLDPRWNGE
ncbi:MAG: anaerobic ribonucleoside-triphosphate reductase activating protein [Spirochaetaceae bacterium]|nr:anaerobic ribonucleoside-triphosphate reductase activating protein [Spirochaetaceae bacterium]